MTGDAIRSLIVSKQFSCSKKNQGVQFRVTGFFQFIWVLIHHIDNKRLFEIDKLNRGASEILKLILEPPDNFYIV